DAAFARWSDDAERGAERDQRRRGIGGMHDVARTAAEDRVELILAGEREALIAAGLVARKSVAVVPAPRPLADIAGDRSDVANLRRRHAARRFGQHRVIATDDLIPAERVQCDLSADRHAAAR